MCLSLQQENLVIRKRSKKKSFNYIPLRMRSCQSAPTYVKSSQLNSAMIQVGSANEYLQEDREQKSFGLIAKHQLLKKEKKEYVVVL